MVFPAYCSMSRAMVRDGTGGWRHPHNPSPSARCMAQPTPEIRALRRSLRALRRSLPRDERQKAERAIGNALRRLKLLRRGHRVAVYLAMPGEVNLRPTIEAGWRAGCLLYAPRITSRRRGTMGFVPFPPGARLRANPNAYGIAEPVASRSAGISPLRSRRGARCRSSDSTGTAIASAWAPATTIGRCATFAADRAAGDGHGSSVSPSPARKSNASSPPPGTSRSTSS